MTQIPLTICDPSQEQFDPKRHRDEVIEVRRAEPLPLLGRRPEASPPTVETSAIQAHGSRSAAPPLGSLGRRTDPDRGLHRRTSFNPSETTTNHSNFTILTQIWRTIPKS